jgi:hypothetical protein
MTYPRTTIPTVEYASLVSPLETHDQPAWLRSATARQRRQFQAHHQLGRQARIAATQLFAEVQSLSDYTRTMFAVTDWAQISPQMMLDLQRQQSLNPGYLDRLQGSLASAELLAAKADAYVATLREEMTIASLKGDLGKEGKQMLEWFINNFATGSAEFPQPGPFIGNRVAVCASLRLLDDVPVPDIILLGPNDDDVPCVAFLPGHPRHALKQYASRATCFAALRKELHEADFQIYFGRFIALQHRQRMLTAWADREALLTLSATAVPLSQGLRPFVADQMTARLLDDARYLIALDPGHVKTLQALGPGFARALTEHIQQGWGVGVQPGEEEEGRAPSDWIAPLRVVRGRQPGVLQRWLPDLGSYRVGSQGQPTGQADAQGRYTLDGQPAVLINDMLYSIKQAPSGTWHIVHPQDKQRYRPVLRHNGHGAWHHSFEQPQYWDRLALLRRLGPLATGFDDERLLQLGRVCGVSNEQLRRVYQLDEPAPALLVHIFERARIQQAVAAVLSRIERGQALEKSDEVAQVKAFYRAVDAYNGGRSPQRGLATRGGSTPPAPADENCTPPPQDLYVEWFARLVRVIATHRYELAQTNTDVAVQALQLRYPQLPLGPARRFLDANRTRMHASLHSNSEPLPLDLDLAQEAQSLEYDARLAHALEGFTQPSSINEDTYILALRLLEHLDGWQAGTALLLRRGDRFGTPLAELGQTDVETTSVYLDDEEGWSATSATQVLLAQDMTEYGFYRALLYAIGNPQRTRLGIGLNEPQRLHQRLQEMALARPVRARLLLGMPVERNWLMPVQASAVQRNPSPDDSDLFVREPIQRRVERLITQHTFTLPWRSAQVYINGLLQRNVPITEQVQQLEQQRLQLDAALAQWIAQSPDSIQRGKRTEAANQLRHAWEAQILSTDSTLAFSNAIGELPPLPVQLPEVSALTLVDMTRIERLPGLLEQLPNLRRLELLGLPLTELPSTLTGLRFLRLLEIANMALIPYALRPLGQLPRLETLILNNMSADPFEWSEQDMNRLTANRSLQALTIRHSNATFGPGVLAALARLPELLSLNLANNRISLSTQDVLDLAGARQLRHLDLAENPLGRMPDLTHMEHLEELYLANRAAPIVEWPTGLQLLPNINLADLTSLVIHEVPVGAGLTRGLHMSSAHLPDTVRERFEEEMDCVGNRQVSFAVSDDEHSESDDAMPSDASEENESPDIDTGRTLQQAPRLFEGMSSEDHAKALQLLVADDRAALEFFALLLKIDVSREAQRSEANIRGRIQALIRGAFDRDLRQALQEQARQAVSCVDRDALVFSQMENLLQAHHAMAKSSDATAAQELIAMATSHWRVHRLQEHVSRHIGGWQRAGHVIDYSEIELYFRIALATRLGLRDQPHTQVFTSYTHWVTADMLEAAYAAVVADQQALLPVYLDEQLYWQRYLDFAYAPRIEAINHWRNRLGEYLDAASTEEQLPPVLSELERTHLRQVLIDSGQLASLDDLPHTLRLNSDQYRQAYAALLRRVQRARRELTEAILAPRPGPSSRR